VLRAYDSRDLHSLAHSRRAIRSIQERLQQGDGLPSQQLGVLRDGDSLSTLDEQQLSFKVSLAKLIKQPSSSVFSCDCEDLQHLSSQSMVEPSVESQPLLQQLSASELTGGEVGVQ